LTTPTHTSSPEELDEPGPEPTYGRRGSDDRPSKHLTSFDGLRGIAAIAVFLHHFGDLSGLGRPYFRQGPLAVDFFFVLSGFVIAQAYEGRLKTDLTWFGYMRLRLARLYPAIFAGAVIGLVVAACSGEKIYPLLALQFLLLPALQGLPFPLNPPQWSLFWELVMNGAHALVFRRWPVQPLILLVIIAAGSLLYRWDANNFWGGLPRVVYSFLAGLLIYRANTAGLKAPRAPYWLVVVALAGCLVTVFNRFGFFQLRELVIVLVVTPALVALAVQSQVPNRFIGLATWLGAVSYPLYAVHYPLLMGFRLLLDHLSGGPRIAGWWVCAVATLIIAAIIERFYDAPIRALLRSRRTAVQ
jgi:peptidoglycan/LPS O-acetylase OafA/YrhL